MPTLANRPPRALKPRALKDSDWDFFLPDDDDAYPDPGDFWMEPDDEE
jgi:hypothetical protein